MLSTEHFMPAGKESSLHVWSSHISSSCEHNCNAGILAVWL